MPVGNPPCDGRWASLVSVLGRALCVIASVNEETEALSCGGLFPGVWQSPPGLPLHTSPP